MRSPLLCATGLACLIGLLSGCESPTGPAPHIASPSSETGIYAIQGGDARSPLAGQVITTRGVVTHVVGAGFFLQDPQGDGDPATSDGVFVRTSSRASVKVGQSVRVRGNVVEHVVDKRGQRRPRTMTEIDNVQQLETLGAGTTILPTLMSLPWPMAMRSNATKACWSPSPYR